MTLQLLNSYTRHRVGPSNSVGCIVFVVVEGKSAHQLPTVLPAPE